MIYTIIQFLLPYSPVYVYTLYRSYISIYFCLSLFLEQSLNGFNRLLHMPHACTQCSTLCSTPLPPPGNPCTLYASASFRVLSECSTMDMEMLFVYLPWKSAQNISGPRRKFKVLLMYTKHTEMLMAAAATSTATATATATATLAGRW